MWYSNTALISFTEENVPDKKDDNYLIPCRAILRTSHGGKGNVSGKTARIHITLQDSQGVNQNANV